MESSHDYRRLRELLEVSRTGDIEPGSDDARALAGDPQLRLAFDRVQRWDASLRAALDRVDVPAGVEDRILARLATNTGPEATLARSLAAVVESVSPSALTQAEPAPAPDVELASRRLSSGVRPLTYWSGIGLAAATAAALVIAAGYWLQLGAEVPIEQLAGQWHAKLSDEWQPIDKAPAEFPFPEAMRVAATGWQWIGKLTPTPVVAYRLSNGKTTARLYAARLVREGLGVAPPLEPQQDTGGKAVGYWRSPQNNGLVYVLVVDDSKLYPAFVRRASMPLAIHLPLRFNAPEANAPRPRPSARKIA